MLSHRCAARVLAPSGTRPRIIPGANALYSHHGPSSALLRPALAPRPQRRTFLGVPIIEPLGNAFMAIHSFTDIPWWLLIPAIGFARTAIFHLPFHVLEDRRRARTALISPLLAAWGAKVRVLNAQDPKAAYERQAKRIASEANLDTRKLKLTNFALSLTSFAICAGTMQHLAGATSTSLRQAATNAPVDPSLASEGLFWFQDLTAADPHGILPVVLGSMMFLRAVPRSMDELRRLFAPGLSDSWSLRLRRIQLVAAPCFAALFMNASVATLLFVISTTASYPLVSRLSRYFRRYLGPVPTNLWARSKGERWYINGPK
ncbi:hypothetical protein VUR80DRAFT_6914 [Thermomyces stellatus]